MSTTLLALPYLSEGQSGKDDLINANYDVIDAALGSRFGYGVKTNDYTVTKADRLLSMNASTSKTFTMPAVSGANAPRTGQPFFLRDGSGALIANSATVTIAVPSGATLNGTINGTAVIYGDLGYAEVVFDGSGYVIYASKGLLDTVDEKVNITEWMDAPTSQTTNNITLPTASNHVPGYVPFRPKFDVGIDQVIFCFGSAGPSSDASNASARYGFYDSSTSTLLPNNLIWATEDALLQGSGHLRLTSDTGFSDITSLSTSLAAKTLSARRIFRKGRLYYLGYHLQPTFSAGTACEITRTALGPQVLKLAAGAQAWPYTMANAPSISVQFSGDTLSRLQFGFRYRRLL